MQLALFLADSEVSSLTQTDDALVIRLAAASVERAALQHGGKSMPGYSRGVSLWLHAVQVEHLHSPFIGRVSSGRLQVAGSALKSIPTPFETASSVQLELHLANGASLLASSQRLSVRFEGEVNFSESLAC